MNIANDQKSFRRERVITRSRLKLLYSWAMFTLLYSPWILSEIKRIVFYLRSCLESQVFFKKIWSIDNWWVVTVLLSHNNYLVRVQRVFGHWRCLPCFLRLEILINFVGNKNNCFFFQKILSRKPSFLKMFLSLTEN